jgi:hypothetical protein
MYKLSADQVYPLKWDTDIYFSHIIYFVDKCINIT